MSSRTETTTSRSLGNYYLIIPNDLDEFKTKSLDHIKKLNKILSIFKDYDDKLSLRILNWGDDIFINVLNKDLDFDSLKELVTMRINILAKEILVDPLYNSPLREPVLERSWLWEKSVLEEYKTLHPQAINSPFDGEAMQEPKEHLFAKEIFVWLQNLPFFKWDPLEPNQSFEVVIKQELTPQEKMIKFLLLKRLAKTFVTFTSLKELEIKTLGVTSQIQAQREFIMQEMQRELELAEDRAREHEEKLDQKIEAVKSSHATERAVLGTALEIARAEVSIQEQNISALKDVCTTQEQRISNLQNQNANLNQRLRDLENRKPRGGRCTIS